MGLVESAVVFIVSALVGGLGIYVGAAVLAGSRSFEHAVWTALIGAAVWGIVSFLVGGIPVVGPVLTFVAYLAVIKWRYRGGWLTAAGIALVAIVTALIVLSVLASFGVGSLSAIGVPGV